MAQTKSKRPPLGVIPKWLHDEVRVKQLSIAIRRYALAGEIIPMQWVSEHNALIEDLKISVMDRTSEQINVALKNHMDHISRS
jgi:hypothetical protein